jgi:membrane associated rhomboid family serine protease
MLIIANQTRFTARSLPVVTLALVAINLLVYLLFQSGDRVAYERAAEHYFSSSLPQVELPRYAAYLERGNDPRAVQALRVARSGASDDDAYTVLLAMQRDRGFMKELNAGAIVRRDVPGYAQWREQRDRFQALMSPIFTERFSLQPGSTDVLRLVTYPFLHGDGVRLLGNLVILLLAGPFVEAALGRLRFLFAYLASGAIAGAAHLLIGGDALIGSSGAISGTMGMVAVLYAMRKVPVFYWLFFYSSAARLPALLLFPAWIVIEALQWVLSPGSRVAFDTYVAGFISGAAIAWLLKPADPRKVGEIDEEQRAAAPAERQSTLLQEARQAAARLDTRRAARAYAELLQEDPNNTQHATAYFNMALQGRDKDTLLDAALRVLWIRTRHARTELRPVYSQMSQAHVLKVLPVDEQLRLARRLVATREDAAALRVLDGLLGDVTSKNLYSRQLADCLLGLFTTYSRHGLRAQAEHIKQRLSQHFPSPGTLGGLLPSREPPLTVRGATTRGSRSTRADPGTVPAGELELDLDTRLHTRWGPE